MNTWEEHKIKLAGEHVFSVRTDVNSQDLGLLKSGVWIYFFLLIFEGALRKWVLPGLADPLLIIRDPFALFLIFKSIQANLWKPGSHVILMWGITILSLSLTLLVGHGNLVVAIYGLRIMVLHFPLIFVIGRIFDRSDVLKLGKAVLWINIFMTLLVGLQFFSPQSAWVNIGVGGVAGSGFSGAAGFFRVPGTFSFTNGLSLFYGFAAAFIFFFWVTAPKEQVNRMLLIFSSLALVAAIPLSISRTVLFEVILSLLFLLCISGKNPKVIKSFLGVIILVVLLTLALSNMSFLQTANMAFTERFQDASSSEGGLEGTLIDRFLGGLYGAITNTNASFSGLGLGIGTNAGSTLLTGEREFLVSEGEWGRLIGEMGFILGMVAILIRISVVVTLLIKAWNSIDEGNLLAWMLMSFGTLAILQGQWAQPTALGFSTMVGGLVLASFNEPDK